MHYGRDYDNAFWNGEQMVFGDGDGELFTGFTSPIDVIGHELTHGVTQYTAGSPTTASPGALNESSPTCSARWSSSTTSARPPTRPTG